MYLFERRLLAAVLVAVAACGPLRAQDETPPEPLPLPPIQYRIDVEGRLSIAIGKDGEFVPCEDFGSEDFAMMGLLGYVTVYCSGGADLVSLTDAVNLFERREGGEEFGIIRTLARKPQEGDAVHHNFLRILAARAAERSGFKPAIGMLKRVLEEEQLDPNLRNACEDALASLNGEPAPIRSHELESIESALASVPRGADALVVQNTSRMPSAGPLMSVARRVGERQTQRLAAIWGDDESASEYLDQGLRRSAMAGNLGYSLAREIGNARLDRVIIALRFVGDFETAPNFFVRLEGVWNLARMEQLLRKEGAPIQSEEHGFSIGGLSGHTASFRERTITIAHTDFHEPGGSDYAKELLTRIRPDATMSLWLADSAPYPEEAGIFRIATASIDMPWTRKEHVRIHTTWATPAAATAVAGWTGGLGRLVAGLVDRADGFESIADAASAIKTVREGKTVDFDVPLPDGDLIEMIDRVFGVLGG